MYFVDNQNKFRTILISDVYSKLTTSGDMLRSLESTIFTLVAPKATEAT